MTAPAPEAGAFDVVRSYARDCGVDVSSEELAELAEELSLSSREVSSVAAVFAYLAERKRAAAVETLLRLSRLPQKVPKTFENFDFGRIQGRDSAALESISSMSNLYARKNIAFIGPGGIGKTHLAQAFGRKCCLLGYKTYYLKATELKEKLAKAARAGTAARAVTSLVRPACLIIDEIGRCSFDKECTDLFFDVIDRRYEKEGPNTLIVTSNAPVCNWAEFFTGDDTLLCTLDRVFDRASVFMMKGTSFRGGGLETFSVEAAPEAVKLSKRG